MLSLRNIFFLKAFFIFLIGLFFCGELFSQTEKMDSLNLLLQNAKSDTARLRIYLALGDECELDDNLKYAEPALKLADKLLSAVTDSTERKKILKEQLAACNFAEFFYQQYNRDTALYLQYLNKELSISKEINDMSRIISVADNVVNIYEYQGNISLALEYCQQSLLFFQKNNCKDGIARFLGNLGDIYYSQLDSTLTINYMQKSLAVYIELKDTTKMADLYSTLGDIYGQFHNVPKAMENFNNAIRLINHHQLADRFSKMLYHRIGRMYLYNGDLLNAKINVEKCLSLAEAKNPADWIPVCLDDLADIYSFTDLNKAEEFHLKALKAGIEMNSDTRVAHSQSGLADVYFKKRDFAKAAYYNSLFLLYVRKLFDADGIRDAENLAAKIDSARGNYKDAFAHFQQYIIYRDQLNSEEVRKAATKEKFQTNYDNQKAIDKKEQEKKDAIAAEEKHKQNIITASVGGGLLLVLIFAGLIFRSLRITRKQKEEIDLRRKETEEQKKLIEEKNKEVLDSIRYAKRIQTSLLPTEKYIDKNLDRLRNN